MAKVKKQFVNFICPETGAIITTKRLRKNLKPKELEEKKMPKFSKTAGEKGKHVIPKVKLVKRGN